MAKATLRTIGQGDVWNVLGETIICKVRGEETFGRFALLEEISPPGSQVPLHFHHETDEIIYILEGKYEFQIGKKKMIAGQGETVVIPRGNPHSFCNLLETPSKLLAIITPSGFENFFAEINNLKEPQLADIIELGQLNDLELVI